MTKYTVIWIRSVFDEVGKIWLESSDRNGVTAATDVIERELSSDAEIKGNPLSEGLRVFDSRPLRAVYSVDSGNRIVQICRIRLL